jgi:hypothetical protein
MKTLFDTLREFRDQEKKEIKRLSRIPGQKALIFLGVFAFILTLISMAWAFLSRYWGLLHENIGISLGLFGVSMLMMLIAYVWVIVHSAVISWKDRDAFDLILRNAYQAQDREQGFLAELSRYSEDELRSEKRVIDEELLALTHRVGMLIGSVRTVGFLPGMLALALVAPATVAEEQTTLFGGVALILAASYLVLYVRALMMQPGALMLERYSRLIMFAIEQKQRTHS